MGADTKVQVTGMGVLSPIGAGLGPFTDGLRQGRTNFSVAEWEWGSHLFRFPVAATDGFDFKAAVSAIDLEKEVLTKARRLRNLSRSASYGLYCALDAWADAGLSAPGIDPSAVAIVAAGSNTQQDTLLTLQDNFREKLQFLNPNYGLNFFDTDIVGILSELLGITGEGHSVASASASGNMALIQACRLITAHEYEAVVVVAPLMDISVYEYQGLTALGAMAIADNGTAPADICRPFDAAHCGFVYGQVAGCLVLESERHAAKRAKQAYGSITGYGISMDANRNPDPSVEGETRSMRQAMQRAGLDAAQVDYVNTHGTASIIGDDVEAQALLESGLQGVKANSTKSLTGHGLSAAGVVEAIATLVQMKEGFIHGSHNLNNPVSDAIGWVKKTQPARISHALSNSFGFGGINTTLIFKKE